MQDAEPLVSPAAPPVRDAAPAGAGHLPLAADAGSPLAALQPPESPETWQGALSRRLRSLLRTAPFHRLEASKALREGDYSLQDLRALALRVLDATIEKMGLAAGATRAELDEVLAPLVRAAEPTASPERVRDVVTLVLDGLLNERERRQAFSEPYSEFGEAGLTRKVLSFHLLREEELPDGTVVARATTEGVNLYAGMLEYDVEDAQTAEEAVLHSQIRRGRIAEAVATAHRARVRSIEYEGKLTGILQTTRRDVTQVDWVHEVLGLLEEARIHLEDRQTAELSLIDAVETRLERADAAAAPQLFTLLETLKECHARHLRLHGELISANQQYLDEQARQAFRPRLLSPLPDPEAELLRPALELPAGALAAQAGELLRCFNPPHVPPVYCLSTLLDRLLAPRRGEDSPFDLSGPELEPLQEPPLPFSAEDEQAVDRLLAGLQQDRPQKLSALLRKARQEGLTPGALHLLVLRALQAFDRDEELHTNLISEPAGSKLDDPDFKGDDLLVSRE